MLLKKASLVDVPPELAANILSLTGSESPELEKLLPYAVKIGVAAALFLNTAIS